AAAGAAAAGAASPGARHRAGRRQVKYRPAAIPALLDGRARGTRGLGGAGPDVVTTGAWRRFRRGIAKLWSQVRLPAPPRQPGLAKVAVGEPGCTQPQLGPGRSALP